MKTKKKHYQVCDYEIAIAWSEEDGLYVAKVLDMPGIMAHGKSHEEAAKEIHKALEWALECIYKDGDQPTPPKSRLVLA